jgi:hypothetical protein
VHPDNCVSNVYGIEFLIQNTLLICSQLLKFSDFDELAGLKYKSLISAFFNESEHKTAVGDIFILSHVTPYNALGSSDVNVVGRLRSIQLDIDDSIVPMFYVPSSI